MLHTSLGSLDSRKSDSDHTCVAVPPQSRTRLHLLGTALYPTYVGCPLHRISRSGSARIPLAISLCVLVFNAKGCLCFNHCEVSDARLP